jgi:hypothetical protein
MDATQEGEQRTMHVIAIHTISDADQFWSACKRGHAQLPAGARWVLAVASTDGTRGINLIVGASLERVKEFFEPLVGQYSATEYFEADAENAVGLPH